MNIYELPKNMQEKILKLASEHLITIEGAKDLYLMGGDHADYLCQLASKGLSYTVIEMENKIMWKKKNEKLKVELNNI